MCATIGRPISCTGCRNTPARIAGRRCPDSRSARPHFYPGDTESLNPLGRRLLLNIALDQKEIFTSPFRINRHNAPVWFAVDGLIAADKPHRKIRLISAKARSGGVGGFRTSAPPTLWCHWLPHITDTGCGKIMPKPGKSDCRDRVLWIR